MARAALAGLLVIATAPASGSASGWVEVGVATNGTRALIDPRSLAGNEKAVTVDQRFTFARADSAGRTRVDQRVTYYCGPRLVRTLLSVEYRSDGTARRFAPAHEQYRIVPGTLPEYIFDVVCP